MSLCSYRLLYILFDAIVFLSHSSLCKSQVLRDPSERSLTSKSSYWGQNSYGATHTSDTANFQQTISYYCQDNSIDVLPVAFLNVFFGPGGLPEVNLANVKHAFLPLFASVVTFLSQICNSSDDPVFAGSSLPNCGFLASSIQACQAKGKIVTLSLGGASGNNVFSSDAQAQSFADQIWNIFLGGSSPTRPFGSAVLDG